MPGARPLLLLAPALAQAAAVEVYHPGHRAEHVTRLHRYDHSGLEAMLEEEARWHRGDFRARSAAAAAADPAAAPAAGRFVPLSRRQAQALREHHRQAMVQLAMSRNATALFERSSRVAPQLRMVRNHITYEQGIVEETNPAVTGLSSLDSQYVGPIGMGTVVVPQSCSPPAGKSLIYLPRSAPGAARAEAHPSCHAEDQSELWVVFDTGSTNFWGASDLCKSPSCTRAGRRWYNHRASSTYADPKNGVLLNIEFGTGKISGPQGIDNIHMGPFTVYNQTFGLIQTQEGRVFDEVPFEGILGLAFPKMSANGVTPFFDNIIKQKALQRNEFAFYFSLDNPAANAVFWGGVDPHFHHGKIEYFKVDDPYYWSTNLISFQVGGHELLGADQNPAGPAGRGHSVLQKRAPQVIVDTGTTFNTAESGLFEEVIRRLPSVTCSRMTEETHPDILYRLQNTAGQLRDFVLRREQYMIGGTPRDENTLCSPAFMKIDIPKDHGPAMVLGEIFLRHHFSVFDRGDGSDSSARIGFAPANHEVAVNRRLSDLTRDQPAFRGARGGAV